MTARRVERISCDNPECVLYVDEIVRQDVGEFELVEHVRSLTAKIGWTRSGDHDFCPAHASDGG
jgi:hypothetical protein